MTRPTNTYMRDNTREEFERVRDGLPVVPYHSGKKTTIEAFEELQRAWANIVRDVGKVMEPFVRHFSDLWVAPPADVMERALQARRNRNTGPTRPTGQAARRPRRHS